MSKKTILTLGVVSAVIAAIVIVVLWPAPDPLRSAQTVFIETPRSELASAQLDDGLSFVLNNRHLTLVSNRAEADVALSVRGVSVNLGDVTLSLSQGTVSGHVKAVCEVVDLQTGKAYTMDLLVTVDHNAVSARLVGRKFWEFWK